MSTSQREGWINWRASEARKVVLEDLEPGGILDGKDHVSAAYVLAFYKKKNPAEFENVVIDQFQERLRDNRGQATAGRTLAARDALALQHDRGLYPRASHNAGGHLVFDAHPAKGFLREDVKNEVHTTMSLALFAKSRP